MSKKIYLYNDKTCTRVKLYGIDAFHLFKANGYKVADSFEAADLIIINTCSFLKSKEDYFLNFIKEVNGKIKKRQKILIIGCLPNINSEDISNINSDIIMLGRDLDLIKKHFNFTKDISTRATSVTDKLNAKKQIIYLLNKYILRSKHIEYRLKRDKVCYLQISSGCMGKCTYCSERFTTKLKSRTIEDIKIAILDGYAKGYRLFGLNSDDASAYGRDIHTSLEKLLTEIVSIDKDVSFSIPEFNPNGLSDKVIDSLKDSKFLYITVPIQSGSQSILDLMERPYNIDEILRRIKYIKENNKKLKINTHIIVGFPGETAEDFQKTKNILKMGLFDRVKVFMYNERPNTKAIHFEGKVSEEEKLSRRNELIKIVKRENFKHFSLTNLILNKEQLK